MKWTKHDAYQLGYKLEASFIVKAGDCRILINKPLTKSRATPEEAEKIANLVAAAPEILSMLSGLVDDIEHYAKVGVGPSSTAMQMAKKLIKKLT